QEIEHTADWALKIWAPSITELLIHAAKGMYTLSGVRYNPAIRRQRSFHFSFEDYETLLVQFLSELLFYGEKDNIAFNRFRISIEDHHLHTTAFGHPILSMDKAIKAVTFHQLQVKHTPEGYEAQVVFDV
ncbi:MAG: archease, partial [Anaerolineales bacterium]